MVWIQGGVYGGSNIEGFWMDTYEVGARDFQACVDGGGCPAYQRRDEVVTSRGQRSFSRPISRTTHEEAGSYCAWLGRELPGIRQWRWAAQGREEARLFAWGGEFPDCEFVVGVDWDQKPEERPPSCDPRSLGVLTRGNRPLGVSRDGVHNLAGNVAEWVDVAGEDRLRYVDPLYSGYSAQADIWVGSSFQDDVDAQPREVPSFSARTTGTDPDQVVGFRCVSATRPKQVRRVAKPELQELADLELHENEGMRLAADAIAYCRTLAAGSGRPWKLVDAGSLPQLDTRQFRPPVPYWTRQAASGGQVISVAHKNEAWEFATGKYARAVCMRARGARKSALQPHVGERGLANAVFSSTASYLRNPQ